MENMLRVLGETALLTWVSVWRLGDVLAFPRDEKRRLEVLLSRSICTSRHNELDFSRGFSSAFESTLPEAIMAQNIDFVISCRRARPD